MTESTREIHLGAAIARDGSAPATGGVATVRDHRYVRIDHVDRMPPFLMSVVSDSEWWLFVGSNGPFTAGRRSPDGALFPYQTVDAILRHPTTSGARTSLLVSRRGDTSLWEPWIGPEVYRATRNLYKRVDGTAVLFEEINHDLGIRFRWGLEACDAFGLVRWSEVTEVAGEPAEVRYLDGFHQVLPPGIDEATYSRLSYLATAYMRHELLPDGPLAVYTLNAAISDRPEPSESLRAAAVWSVGHHDPTILLSDGQVEAFRRGGDVHAESEVRGQVGAYLVVDAVSLPANGGHGWRTVGDTGLDHAAVIARRSLLQSSAETTDALDAAVAENQAGVRRRVAGADGQQHSADAAVSASHYSSVLFNIMRGGSFDDGYRAPPGDFAAYLQEQNRDVFERHRGWVERLPPGPRIQDLQQAADRQGDPQLARLARSYLPLTFSRRHGDPSRPWNRFSIRLRDDAGRPIYGYQGNWRDIFQNWEALGVSYPGYLLAFIAVYLNASTADGYNPYRIARSGVDWEVEDPSDPWSHIGYWGDHQIVYLLRLLEALERHQPGSLARSLDERVFSYASVPYRIAGIDAILADPRSTIEFDHASHEALVAAADDLGADGRLMRDEAGEVRLVTLLEKLLVPPLVKLTNLVPGGGVWLNTQRPEWNDANNALAGWGLSIVTLCALRRYLALIGRVLPDDASVAISVPVASLLRTVTSILEGVRGDIDGAERHRILVELGRAGEVHRRAVYAGELDVSEDVSAATVHALLAAASPVIEDTIRANRRDDGLWHSYNLLKIDGQRAQVDHLGLMLEGQVAILDARLLDGSEAVSLLRALRQSSLYRADQHSYLLHPDRSLTPYLQRNTLDGQPPIRDSSLFVTDVSGRWHFNADLSTIGDVELRLRDIGAGDEARAAVLELWRTTFRHDEFLGRSGRFFMFEGLGSVYWHMVAKLLLAIQECHRREGDGEVAAALAEIYHDVRDGLGFRKTPEAYGAFPTDPYSHTPRHLGAQQPGMTGHAKEQVLMRFGELGVEVSGGHLRMQPRLLHRDEFFSVASTFTLYDASDVESSWALPPDSLAFTYCQVPVSYRWGDRDLIDLERFDGGHEVIAGLELGLEASTAIFERRGVYRRITVTLADHPSRE